MKSAFTPEQIDYLRRTVKGCRFAELTKMFNNEFGANKTSDQIRSACSNRKFHNGCKKGWEPGQNPYAYSEAEVKFLEQNIEGRSIKELTKLYNTHFQSNKTESQIRAACNNRKFCSGKGTRFQRGHTPWNKDTKGYTGANSTSFRKGIKPHNYLPIGTEISDSYGYIKAKVAEPKAWEHKHKIVYRQYKGEIPKGCVVLFADGDKRNFTPDNLILVSRAQLAYLNRNRLISVDSDVTKAAVNIAAVAQAAAKTKRESEG